VCGLIATVAEGMDFAFGAVGEESTRDTFQPVVAGDEVGEVVEDVLGNMRYHIIYGRVWYVRHNPLFFLWFS
jgi:hypothetical protein